MFLVRQSCQADVDQILKVARYLDTVNLPAKADHIAEIVGVSEQSFSGELDRADREFLFVLEDTESGEIIGTSMIHAQHGSRRAPHVFFEVLKDERYSDTIDRYFRHECLRMGYDYDGPTEIGGLILLPSYRGGGRRLGTLLSYTRFLFIAMHRAMFRDRVLSELLPPLEADGTSLFWKHLGRRFTGLSYSEADLLSKHNKEFIRALFPHSLIYTALFPAEVKEMIGKVAPATQGVEKILRRIGFEFAGTLDPFDGGPHFMADTDDITLVRNSRNVEVTHVDGADESRPWAILGRRDSATSQYRGAAARVIPSLSGDSVGLTTETCSTLGVSPGDEVWMVIP